MHRRLKDEKLRVAYTAFGDPVMPDGQGGWRVGWPVDLGTRYQYDGGWGYESGAWGPGPGGQGAVGGPLALWGENIALPPVTLQHVGWRCYQPSIGRFIQRDPIGLKGGLNVYTYVEALPTILVDPSGQSSLLRPDAFVVLVENALMSGPVTVIIGGKEYVIVSCRYAGDHVVFILKNGSEISSRILPKIVEATQWGNCIFVHNPPKGACGATGIESAPILLWLLPRQRADRRRHGAM